MFLLLTPYPARELTADEIDHLNSVRRKALSKYRDAVQHLCPVRGHLATALPSGTRPSGKQRKQKTPRSSSTCQP